MPDSHGNSYIVNMHGGHLAQLISNQANGPPVECELERTEGEEEIFDSESTAPSTLGNLPCTGGSNEAIRIQIIVSRRNEYCNKLMPAVGQ